MEKVEVNLESIVPERSEKFKEEFDKYLVSVTDSWQEFVYDKYNVYVKMYLNSDSDVYAVLFKRNDYYIFNLANAYDFENLPNNILDNCHICGVECVKKYYGEGLSTKYHVPEIMKELREGYDNFLIYKWIPKFYKHECIRAILINEERIISYHDVYFRKGGEDEDKIVYLDKISVTKKSV